MSKIVELKAGEIETVVGGAGANAAPLKPTSMGNQLNASTVNAGAVNANTFQMPSISTNLLAARRY